MDVVLRAAVWTEELSCFKGGDRLGGLGSGKHSGLWTLLSSFLSLVTVETSSFIIGLVRFTLPEPARFILLYFVTFTQPSPRFAWPTPPPDMSATLRLTPLEMTVKESSLY